MMGKLLAGIMGLLVLTAPAAARTGTGLERAIDGCLAPLLRTNNFSGVVLVAKDDVILFQKGYGRANVEHGVANRPSTIFQIASVSKPFTAAAVLLLAEQGKLGLKAPLSAILPGYPRGDRLTIHHLLSHTSGIPNINDFDEYADAQRRPQTTDSLVALFRDRPLEFGPGERFSYSNSNYNLLAHIIEKVSGESFGNYLARAIFSPLGLSHTGHPRSAAEIVPGIASGYAPVGSLGLERAAFLDWSVKTGNGSLYSDAAGVMRFMRAVHRGKLLNKQSIVASFTPHTPNVGYGWFVTQANKRDIHHINGRSPGFAAQADYYVASGVTVIVLSNTYV
ncbi:MAG: beta-lactamase family protein, partial [Pseudomonadota bacterium]|nr:beta-lactamase family protein [Pseudomonadota bacterium]